MSTGIGASDRSAFSLRVETGWCDLVFHVLAHVDTPGLPSNLVAPSYVRWVDSRSPAEAGRLREDRALLAALLNTPERAIVVQPLAVLFRDTAQALRAASRELTQLTAADVELAAWLPVLLTAADAAELLRCSCLLEASRHATLPAPAADLAGLQAALARVAACAPQLSRHELVLCRALTHHGRAFGARLYLGVPSAELDVSLEHVAMQAAHEASVCEAARSASALGLGERDIEQVATAVLAARAARTGLTDWHARWGARFGVRSEHAELSRLPEPQRALAQQLLEDQPGSN